MAFSYGWRGPNIIKDGLVLYLDAGSPNSFYSPTAGTTWKDISGQGNNGTLTNGPTYSSANGGSIVFDGTNDYVNIGVDKSCNRLTDDFAVSVWLNRSSSGSFGNVIGDYYTNSTNTNFEWQLGIDQTSFIILYVVGTGYIFITSSGLGTNTWINLVISRIGSTLTMYANSNSIATTTNTTTFGSATGNLNIGIDGNNSSEAFKGNISNVLIYKGKGLTSNEVLYNYNTTKGRYGL